MPLCLHICFGRLIPVQNLTELEETVKLKYFGMLAPADSLIHLQRPHTCFQVKSKEGCNYVNIYRCAILTLQQSSNTRVAVEHSPTNRMTGKAEHYIG